MNIGTLYDLAKQYLPAINKRLFTIMYNEALAKVTQELRVEIAKEEVDVEDFASLADKIVKVISVSVDGKEISRVVKR